MNYGHGKSDEFGSNLLNRQHWESIKARYHGDGPRAAIAMFTHLGCEFTQLHLTNSRSYFVLDASKQFPPAQTAIFNAVDGSFAMSPHPYDEVMARINAIHNQRAAS